MWLSDLVVLFMLWYTIGIIFKYMSHYSKYICRCITVIYYINMHNYQKTCYIIDKCNNLKLTLLTSQSRASLRVLSGTITGFTRCTEWHILYDSAWQRYLPAPIVGYDYCFLFEDITVRQYGIHYCLCICCGTYNIIYGCPGLLMRRLFLIWSVYPR